MNLGECRYSYIVCMSNQILLIYTINKQNLKKERNDWDRHGGLLWFQELWGKGRGMAALQSGRKKERKEKQEKKIILLQVALTHHLNDSTQNENQAFHPSNPSPSRYIVKDLIQSVTKTPEIPFFIFLTYFEKGSYVSWAVIYSLIHSDISYVSSSLSSWG